MDDCDPADFDSDGEFDGIDIAFLEGDDVGRHDVPFDIDISSFLMWRW